MIRCAIATVLAATFVLGLRAQGPALVTVGDLMTLRTIVDVEIAPAGDRVAYVVSAPSIANNAHESSLFVVPSSGPSTLREPQGRPEQSRGTTSLRARGETAVRVASDVKVFTPTLPAPRLRWSPDGSVLTFLGVSDGARRSLPRHRQAGHLVR